MLLCFFFTNCWIFDCNSNEFTRIKLTFKNKFTNIGFHLSLALAGFYVEPGRPDSTLNREGWISILNWAGRILRCAVLAGFLLNHRGGFHPIRLNFTLDCAGRISCWHGIPRYGAKHSLCAAPIFGKIQEKTVSHIFSSFERLNRIKMNVKIPWI